MHATAAPPPLVFGIYPGGAAGAVGPGGQTIPEDPAKRLAALQQLRPAGRPFVLHLYAQYSGPDGWTAAQQVGQEVANYGSEGFETEVVLTYRPSDGGSPADVAGYQSFVRDAVDALGADPGFVSLQVTDEANVTGAPNASDGYYADAENALIEGVIAAKDEIRQDGFTQVKVGFNWAYATGAEQASFWSYLGTHGGAQFLASLDWVGLDVYPGTWGPSLGSGSVTEATARFMDTSLKALRNEYMPLAGIARTVPIVICESGYPTGPSRSDATQVEVAKASILAVDAARGTYNVTGYRWFDLRDADSSSSSFESQYGLLRDDYTPKPAFYTYRQLVAELSVPHAATASASARR
jgi:hypothetical protein